MTLFVALRQPAPPNDSPKRAHALFGLPLDLSGGRWGGSLWKVFVSSDDVGHDFGTEGLQGVGEVELGRFARESN